MKKLPVHWRASRVRIVYAASAMMSGVRPSFGFAIGMTCNAAVAITVRGHNAFTPMPSWRNSSAMPSTHMLMPYFAIVYATCGANHFDFMLSGGDRLRTWGLRPAFAGCLRYG